jgi:putative drug exporter of the RND superfamily
LIVPAAIALMGGWNWWLPRWPARLLRVEPLLPPRVAAGEAKA